MKLMSKLTAGATTLAMSAAMLFSFGGVASADCFQYSGSGMTTSSTPVFNNICGAPENIGNESDFVRVRQNTNGNDMDNANNGSYTGGTLSAACNDGDRFDVWNYLHNDASQDANDNGNGTAVAHNVQSHLTAQLGSGNSFNFGDTISASNAASVSDSAALSCGKQVQLSVVPGSVHIYSIPYGAWKNLGDGSVNGTTKLGSPTLGSGDVWGCWNYRVVVVYQVKVTVPQVPGGSGNQSQTQNQNQSQNQQITVNQAAAPAALAAPTSLVNTGAGSVAGIFAATAAAGTFGYRRFLARRLGA